MKLLKWIKNIIKNNTKKMITEDQLISYQQNFSGQEFQWIKTDRPELMGKLVKVRDIRPSGRSAVAIFDDGSQVDVTEINNKLMMIHGDMQPLSRAEVNSISAPRKPEAIPPTKLANGETTAPISPKAVSTSPNIEKPVMSSPEPPVANPFAMFNSDETEITLKLNIKIPDKKLLKMMYSNAEDKELFIDQLSKYVNSLINNKVVNESMVRILDYKKTTSPKPKPKGEEIKLTEVDEK
jgi:hypothetical protein